MLPTFFLQDSSGIFWDNDSLSALLALELKADLLILLSDVDGLYNGPPSDPLSKLIHTYIKEKHQNEITFGDKSRVGRGGMTAKVKASVHAADAGIPVIITRCIAVLFLHFSKAPFYFILTHFLWHHFQLEIHANSLFSVMRFAYELFTPFPLLMH